MGSGTGDSPKDRDYLRAIFCSQFLCRLIVFSTKLTDHATALFLFTQGKSYGSIVIAGFIVLAYPVGSQEVFHCQFQFVCFVGFMGFREIPICRWAALQPEADGHCIVDRYIFPPLILPVSSFS